MSSNNDCIKFHLDIEDQNIVFFDYLKKYVDGKHHTVYLGQLIQLSCPFSILIILNIMATVLLTCVLLLLMLAILSLSDLKSNMFFAMIALKGQWLNLTLLINIAISLTYLNVKH